MNKKIITAIGTVALFLSTVTPTFASTTIQISGNGTGSNNHITVTSNNVNSLSQNNLASISNNVTSNGSTGGNNSSGNTGGNVTIHTGSSNSITTITTRANINIANIGCCVGQCK